MRTLRLVYGRLRESSQPTFSTERVRGKRKIRTLVRATQGPYNRALFYTAGQAPRMRRPHLQVGEAEPAVYPCGMSTSNDSSPHLRSYYES